MVLLEVIPLVEGVAEVGHPEVGTAVVAAADGSLVEGRRSQAPTSESPFVQTELHAP